MFKLSCLMGVYLLTSAGNPIQEVSVTDVPQKIEKPTTRAPRSSKIEEQNLPIYVDFGGKGASIPKMIAGDINNIGPAVLAFVGKAGSLDSSWKFVAGPYKSNLLVDTTRRSFELDDVHNNRIIWKAYDSRADVNGNLFECQTDNVHLLGNVIGYGGIQAVGNIQGGGTLNIIGSGTIGNEFTVGSSTTLNDTLTVNSYTTINSTLHTTGATTLDTNVSIGGPTTVSSSLNVTGNLTEGSDIILEPLSGQVSNIKFTNNVGGEKARISSSDSSTERGIYVSIDDGTTKNLHVDDSGSTILSSGNTLQLGIYGQIYDNRSLWSLTAGNIGYEATLHRTLALTFDHNLPNRTIATVYDGREDVIGNLLEIDTDNVFLTGEELCQINAPVTITNGVGLAPVNIVNSDLTITNGNLTAVNGSFTGPVGVCTSSPTNYKFEVIGNSHINGNLQIDGSTESVGNVDLGKNSYLSYQGDAVLQSYGPNDGTDNIFLGIYAGDTYVWGEGNVAVGGTALPFVEGGNENIAIGLQTLPILYDGNYNIAIGSQAGGNYGNTESNNICLGYNVKGTANESNVTRIGDSMSKTFISGIDGVNVGPQADVVGVTSLGQLGTQATNWNLTGNLTTSGNASIGNDVQFSSIINPSTGITSKLFTAGTPQQTSRMIYGYYSQAALGFISNTGDMTVLPGTRIGRYLVSWTSAFSANPVVLITPALNDKTTVAISEISINGCIVQCQTNGVDAYCDFFMLVVGPN